MARLFKTLALATLATGLFAPIAMAEGFQRIDDERNFMSVLKDRELKRFGIRLQVGDDGVIQGRAFGQKVSGAWDWENGYFCRDLFLAAMNLMPTNVSWS